MLNSLQHNWIDMKLENIIGGVAPDGVSYLKSFLQDYKITFHVQSVNPNCHKCLNNYLTDFKKKYSLMENKSDYILLKKREGISLEFGSSIAVNNSNLTNEFAEILIKRFKAINSDFHLSDLFEKFPEEIKKEVTQIEVISEEITVKPLTEKVAHKRKRK